MLRFNHLITTTFIFLLSFTVLNTGCSLLHHQVKPDKATVLDEETFPKLNITHSVNIKVDSQLENKKFELCGPHYVNKEDMSSCAIDILKEIFKNNNIKVFDKGEKLITLNNIEAKCNRQAFGLEHEVKMEIKAGDTIKKQYQSTRSSDGFATTWAIERAIGDTIHKMLNDPDVIQYFQK